MKGNRSDSAAGVGANHGNTGPERGVRALAWMCGLWLCANAAACTQPTERTQVRVRVRIEAEAAVKALADDVEVVVETQVSKSSGWEQAKPQRFEPKATHSWPLEFTVEKSDPSLTYLITATARDTGRSLVAQARAIREGGTATKQPILLVFENACVRRMQCPSGETCHAGECVDAHYESTFDPTAGSGDSGPSAEDAGPDPGGPTLAVEGEACAPDGARACIGESSRTPLVCESGSWQSASTCAEDELCDITAGSLRGTCRRVATECLGHDPNVPFCDRDLMRVCPDMFGFEVRNCLENEHCVAKTEAKCECKLGFVPAAIGCERPHDCSVANGGCDPVTQCSMSGMERVCTVCPGGYVGKGETGCEPLLSGLTTSASVLDPAFDPAFHSYRVKVPLLAQQLTLTPSAASAARIELNGSVVASDQGWTTPTLPLDELPVKLTLTSSSGATSDYDVVVERAGKQTAYLKASNTGEGDNFGIGVAISGDTLVVGALFEDSAAMGVDGDASDNSARDAGAAYVFIKRGDVWEQQAYLKPLDSAAQDYFGVAMAIEGDTLVIGAVHTDITGLSGTSSRPGAAYVFTRSDGRWSQTKRLAGAMANDAFGYGVAISGNTIAVAAPNDGGDGTTYVFTRNGADWVEQQKLKAQPSVDRAMFGSAVSLSKDTLLIGASNDSSVSSNAGAAYVFARNGATWTLRQRLTADPAASGANFGYSLALVGDEAVIGAPRAAAIVAPVVTSPGQVFAFRRTSDGWGQTQVLQAMLPRSSDAFGSSVALSSTALLIGASGDRSGAKGVGADASRRDVLYSGAGYLYARDTGQWKQSAYLKPANTGLNDSFGFGAALSGSAAVLTANWEQSKASGVNGNANDDSANTAGAVYVFE